MSYREPLSQMVVAISISDNSDMPALGLAPEHLRDAMTEIARHLLAMGARLAYGGDLRADGFTQLLFELVSRYRRDADIGDVRPAIINYFAWPVFFSMNLAEKSQLVRDLGELAELHFLDPLGTELNIFDARGWPPRNLKGSTWAQSLTAMRNVMTRISDARVVLGGRTTGYKGRMPGVAEEALLALESGQPLFLLGGFGGCARDIAGALSLLPLSADNRNSNYYDDFKRFDASSLQNGLNKGDNVTLARTVHIDEAVTLILRGLIHLRSSNGG